MAYVSSQPMPLTPPPAVYSPSPVRSQSPQTTEAQRQRPSEPRRVSSGQILQRRDLAPSPLSGHTPSERAGPVRLAQVQIYSPDEPVYNDAYDNDRSLSPILSHFPRRDFSNGSFMEGLSAERIMAGLSEEQLGAVSNSSSRLHSLVGPGIHEPLQYHHLQDQDLAKRASRPTVGRSQSNSLAPDLSTQQLRNSHLGADLQRPDSGFSSQSDQRGRTLSPHLSPQRPRSRNSRSPDSRPLSYIDLLNVPYPQPAPGGTENLINQGLRNAVGQNASLLSTRKTLDMYRMNVKKTNDPAIQYDFAIFMISAAQEEGLDVPEDPAVTTTPPKSSQMTANVRADLLKEAKHILQKLSDRSYPFAQYYLADGYASGLFNNGKPDLDRSFPLFLAASKHGHAEAMYRTALCYEYGWGTPVSAAKAVQFYQHAASKNHPGAMLRLGRACLTGEMGLTKRYREGVRWLKRGSESADLQYNQAPYDLACLHEEGYGPDVFKDEGYAAQLFTKAADLGHKDGAFRLGEAYEYGQLTCPKDPSLSIHFYTTAAEQGHPTAQMALCAWYMVGVENVLEKDEGEAYEWARRAAEQGLAKAQYTVGYFTEMGIGCRRDPLEANVWYVRAADQGEERAKHRMSAIRAASNGVDPMIAAKAKIGKPPKQGNGTADAGGTANGIGKVETSKADGEKKKKFGIF